ncbi:MAG: hypothetical protein M1815_003425 [Lichina confinis]|nr:MAG: hypothetical protein M1815_003425 [Lichina confinis]
MSNQKDMRREELIVPYMAPPAKDSETELSGTLASILPMAAMFTRSKAVGWTAVWFAVQHWLGETSGQNQATSQPAYFTVALSMLSLVVTYVQIILGQKPVQLPPATDTEAPPAVPPSFEGW